MKPVRRAVSSGESGITWSISAGLYLFLSGTVFAVLLSDVLVLLGDVIGLPTDYALVILASPALVIGSVVWWAVVERRGSYAYLVGGIVGLLTALLTGALWVLRFVSVWGLEMMLASDIVLLLVVFVLGVAAAVGALTGVPLMYARRRLHNGRSGEKEHLG